MIEGETGKSCSHGWVSAQGPAGECRNIKSKVNGRSGLFWFSKKPGEAIVTKAL